MTTKLSTIHKQLQQWLGNYIHEVKNENYDMAYIAIDFLHEVIYDNQSVLGFHAEYLLNTTVMLQHAVLPPVPKHSEIQYAVFEMYRLLNGLTRYRQQ